MAPPAVRRRYTCPEYALVLRDTSNDGCCPIEGAMPKPNEVGRRHAADRPHGGASLGHATHLFKSQRTL